MQKLKDVKIGVSRVLILCLICIVLTAGIVIATSPTQPFTITRGVFPGADSVTIWGEDGEYCAKNQYGVLIYSGNDFATIFQGAINSIQRGTIFIKTLQTDYYYISETIMGKSNIIIDGEGQGNPNTRLIWDGDANGIMFDFRDCTQFGIKNLELFGGESDVETNANTFLITGGSPRPRQLQLNTLFIFWFKGTVIDFGAGLEYGERCDFTSLYNVYIEGGNIGFDGFADTIFWYGGGICGQTSVSINAQELASAAFYSVTFAGSDVLLRYNSDNAAENRWVGDFAFYSCWMEVITGSLIAPIGSMNSIDAAPIIFENCRLGIENDYTKIALGDVLRCNVTISGGHTVLGGTATKANAYLGDASSGIIFLNHYGVNNWNQTGGLGQMYYLP